MYNKTKHLQIQNLISRIGERQTEHAIAACVIKDYVKKLSDLMSEIFNPLWKKYFKNTEVNAVCSVEGGCLSTPIDWTPSLLIYNRKNLKVDAVKFRKFCKEFEQLTGLPVVTLK